MAQVDSSKAKRSYKKQQRKVEGRKGRDGSEAVIELGVLRDRIQDLVGLRIALGQATRKFQEAIKATAEQSGLVSATVMKFVKARAGDNFREERMKAQQIAMVFDEVGELDAGEAPEREAVTADAPEENGNGKVNGNGAHHHDDDDDDKRALDNSPVSNPVEARANGKRRRGTSVSAPE